MSFILDALKKSENERQRQSGPALFEVKSAVRRTGLPNWAIGLGALLIVNAAIVVWLLLREPAQAQVTASVPAAAVQAPAAPSPQMPAPPPVAVTVPDPATTLTPEPLPLEGVGDAVLNADDYEPAVHPAAANVQEPSRVSRGNEQGLPSYAEAAQASGAQLPPLSLDMHVYAEKPQERFVFLNMQRLREGDSLPEGVRVELITTDGVVLSHRGSKFVLQRQ